MPGPKQDPFFIAAMITLGAITAFVMLVVVRLTYLLVNQ